MKPNEAKLGGALQSLSVPLSHLAIVSPCSTCKNQRDSISADGKPACPRREWMQRQKDYQAEGIQSDFSLDHLVLTGNEGVFGGESTSLRNPAYFDNEGRKSIIVWVATLKGNSGIIDGAGNTVTPHILHKDFDTDYINCHPVPFVPGESESRYFQSGAFKESDEVEVVLTHDHQLEPNPDPVGAFRPVMIAGLVNKMNFLYRFPRKPVEKDESPTGT